MTCEFIKIGAKLLSGGSSAVLGCGASGMSWLTAQATETVYKRRFDKMGQPGEICCPLVVTSTWPP